MGNINFPPAQGHLRLYTENFNPLSPGVLDPGNYGVFRFQGEQMKIFENIFFFTLNPYISVKSSRIEL